MQLRLILPDGFALTLSENATNGTYAVVFRKKYQPHQSFENPYQESKISPFIREM